jgi:putative transposase
LLKLSCRCGYKSLVAENMALRQQLLVLNRARERSPRLTLSSRLIIGILSAYIKPERLSRIAIVIKPSSFIRFHKGLVKKKYSLLYTSKKRCTPSPQGPSQELINLILEMKRRNKHYGYRRIAMQISYHFGFQIDKDVVRRVLLKHYKPTKDDGPSWLSFIGHTKDSLWSMDLFRCESILLKSHWVLVILDQYTRRIIGFAVHQGDVDGATACLMFNRVISSIQSSPKYLSTDNDPLFNYYRFKANLRILDIKEIKSLPCQPRSHPFIERLIGTVRRELLDRTLFWTSNDLQSKLDAYQHYYNDTRCHMGIGGDTPSRKYDKKATPLISVERFRWKKSCRGLFDVPIAA